MILVVGGRGSGKRSYAGKLGYAAEEMSAELSAACPVLLDAHELVRDPASDSSELARQIAESKDVVLACEVGSGIVPLDQDERAWRDRAGALSQQLAQQASVVVRMVCGLPECLKGKLPRESVQLVIMRHGRTTANERHAYAGVSDVELTAEGEAQALEAGVCPQVGAVYVSPLSRARRTAQLCFPNAELRVDEGFREMDFGDFEGRSAADMEDDDVYRAWVDGRCEGRCPNGGCRAELEAHTSEALVRAVRRALAEGDERVVVVGHGGTIMAAMDAFGLTRRDYFEWQVGNCEGYRMTARFSDGRLELSDEERFDRLSFMGAGLEGVGSHPEPGPSFFANRACSYFPCHEGVPEDEFNCLFCYCPLYALGPDCGGNFTYTDSGRKNCKGCALPHKGEAGAKLVTAHYEQLAKLAGK